ncbi:phosphoenolpyruvate-protein phosphotransferase (plasmid) [Deinococcus proteolyticus MRP]|uniref:phosphoenolpyruvate--protein phosphotransferase n=1 Tax=Deinococcus proteolyticus (strain ATCC 35074 / DSM 20540 / JCM 6276 / NBRC 101906 / NCIMB 13154 / VKM Ac-1939 / CCM 2703 / MRP) TaxID=693977 RepID=F0RPP2_DEIPM|nr:phosphoenolpyruvate--protein phosphotransferase [Deinococcus proteolyticus]ADY27348.1 phosphoenolpyruvate-protein phosphotransferase [Deinococcus proteolyticus MRP]
MIQLSPNLVRLGAQASSKQEAIRQVAELLSQAGHTDPAYFQGMLAREEQANTYLGSGIAIPHGTPETRHLIQRTGVAVLQVPGGVDWGGDTVRLVVGIAAASDEHLDILRQLTRVLNDPALVERLSTTGDPAEVVAALGGKAAPAALGGAAAPAALGGAAAPATPAPTPSDDLPYTAQVTLPNPQGMHARPASRLAGLVRAQGGRLRLARENEAQSADATRLMEVLGLGLKQGTVLTLSSDSEALLQAARDAIRAGLGDDLSAAAAPAAPQARREPTWVPAQVSATLEGVPAADGLVTGVTRQYRPQALEVRDEGGDDPAGQAAALDRALAAARAALDVTIADVQGRLGADKAAIFRAHQELLDDSGVLEDVAGLLLAGHGAAWAYRQVTDERIAALQKLDDPVLAGRAADLGDVQRRVLRALLGLGEEQPLDRGEPFILLAPDLTPSDTARLSLDTLLGFATEVGGPTSHTAIMARGLGVPAVVAAGAGLRDIPDGTPAILDGSSGRLYLRPSEADLHAAAEQRRRLEAGKQAAFAGRMQPGQTRDGTRVEVAANINRAADAGPALEHGAEGVGLMRTEFLYLESDHAPTEDEQEREYRAMAEVLAGRPLIIRTLDIGGDKAVPYLGLEQEDNSFLGIRGIRLCFERPDLFLPQLRAIARVAKDHPNVHVMFPMIATLADLRRARGMLEDVCRELDAPRIPVGVMIEVPSAALMARELAPEVDFFSVGTNDLTGYTLAMDRLHPVLARQADALHPAVLRLIAVTAEAAQAHGKWVGVCGGAAAEPAGALVLAGLGVRELSVSTPAVPAVKAALRRHDLTRLQEVARQALAQPDAAAVRALLEPLTEAEA